MVTQKLWFLRGFQNVPWSLACSTFPLLSYFKKDFLLLTTKSMDMFMFKPESSFSFV